MRIRGLLQPIAAMAVLLLLRGSVAAAPPGRVVLNCRAGWPPLVARPYSDEWLPVRVEVTNYGPPIQGKLVVTWQDAFERPRRYERAVDLPANSRQVHEVAVHAGRGGSPEVSIEEGGERVAAMPIAIGTGSGSPELRVLIIDADEAALNDVSKLVIDAVKLAHAFQPLPPTPNVTTAPLSIAGAVPPPSGGKGATGPPAPPPPSSPPIAAPSPPVSSVAAVKVALAVARPDDLPYDQLSLSAVDTLVINNAPFGDLVPEKVEAMRLWVAQGGNLVVAGGADLPGLRRLGLDDVLPVDIVERRTLPALASLERVYGRFSVLAPVLVTVATPRRSAEVLLGDDGLPVVVQRPFGLGMVRFVAVDPGMSPLRGWPGHSRFWGDVFVTSESRLAAMQSAGSRSGLSSSGRLGAAYLELAGISAPSVGVYFIFLLLYLICIGPLNYGLLRTMRKLDYAWLTVPATIVLFSAGTIVVAHVARGFSSRLVHVSLDQYFEAEGIVASEASAFIVPASNATYRLHLPDGALGDDSTEVEAGRTSEPSVVDQSGRGGVLIATMNTWENRFFTIDQVVREEPPVNVRIDGIHVTVRNETTDDLRGVTVIGPDGVCVLGAIEPGGTVERDFGTAAGTGSLQRLLESGLADGNDRMLVAAALERPDVEVFGDQAVTSGSAGTHGLSSDTLPDHPMLFAVRAGNASPVRLANTSHVRRLSLLVVHLAERQ